MIIYAVQRSVLDTRFGAGAGNWKDYQSCVLLLSDLGKPFKIVEFEDTYYQTLICQCSDDVRHLIMNYSWYPEILAAIRTEKPWIKLHVRTHNAEALQHIHRAELSIIPNYKNIRSIYGTVRLAWRDSKCKRIADTLLGISEWDDKHYWKLLPGNVKIEYMPYFSPWSDLKPDIRPLPWEKRERMIVSMPGARDPISTTMIRGFNILTQRICDEQPNSEWRFLLTRGTNKLNKIDSVYEKVEFADIMNPYELLCKVRAVAVLTPFGFGIKTTIVDAIDADCHVLVHPKLLHRLPLSIREKCIVINPKKYRDLGDLIKKLDTPPPPEFMKLNENLRQMALKALKRALLRKYEN